MTDVVIAAARRTPFGSFLGALADVPAHALGRIAPQEVPAWGVNQVCGLGLRAVALAFGAIRAGGARLVVAGGQESM